MTSRAYRLQQFFGGYFHQDWDVEGASSWQEVIDAYVANAPPAAVETVLCDLSTWLVESADDASPNLPPSFGCEYDPRGDGLTEREWVLQIVDRLGRLRHGDSSA